MKFDVDNYFEESVGRPKIDQRGPNRDPEGSLARPPRARQTPSWMPGGPPRCPLWPILPPWVETPKQEEFWSFAAASWRKPTEKKKPSPAGRFRRGDHLLEGEIITIVTG